MKILSAITPWIPTRNPQNIQASSSRWQHDSDLQLIFFSKKDLSSVGVLDIGGWERITRIFEKKQNTAPLLHLYYGAYISCDQQLKTEEKNTSLVIKGGREGRGEGEKIITKINPENNGFKIQKDCWIHKIKLQKLFKSLFNRRAKMLQLRQ